MYTINELASILKLSHWTIRKKIASGDIESVKIFGAIRIPPEEVEALKTVGRQVAPDSSFSPKPTKNKRLRNGRVPWEK